MKQYLKRLAVTFAALYLAFLCVAATYKSLTIDGSGWCINAETPIFARLKASIQLYADAIAEYSADSGVTIDGVLLKDGAVAAGAVSLSTLADVDIATPVAGQVLGLSLSGDWVNTTTTGGAVSLSTLSDVAPDTPVAGQVLGYGVSGAWENTAVMANPMTAGGDLIYGNNISGGGSPAIGYPLALPIGSLGELLTVAAGGAPAWTAATFTAAQSLTSDLAATAGNAGRMWMRSDLPSNLKVVVAHTNELVYTRALDTGEGGFDGYSMRTVIPAAAITESCTSIRLRFENGGGDLVVDNASIAEQSVGPDASTTPMEILFSAASGFSLTGGSYQTILSDPLTFALDESKSYLVTCDLHVSSGSNICKKTGITGWTSYYAGGANYYDIADFPGDCAVRANEAQLVTEIVQSNVGYSVKAIKLE